MKYASVVENSYLVENYFKRFFPRKCVRENGIILLRLYAIMLKIFHGWFSNPDVFDSQLIL